MLKARQVSIRRNKTLSDISKELGFLADVVPGGVYFVLNGLSKHMGILAVCVWVVKVVKSCLSVYFTFCDASLWSFIAG